MIPAIACRRFTRQSRSAQSEGGRRGCSGRHRSNEGPILNKAVFAVSFALLVTSALARGQALPTASREPIEIGAAFSFGSPGYQETPTYVEGVTIFANAPIFRRLGAEIDVHLDSIITPIDVGENTYLIGPRFSIVHENQVTIYAKAVGGLGSIAYQSGLYSHPHSDSYGVFAAGAGIEFRLTPKLNVRAIDLEFQDWPNFPGGALHPVVASIGIGWRL